MNPELNFEFFRMRSSVHKTMMPVVAVQVPPYKVASAEKFMAVVDWVGGESGRDRRARVYISFMGNHGLRETAYPGDWIASWDSIHIVIPEDLIHLFEREPGGPTW